MYLYIDKVYAAMFSEDGEWYRCVVKQLFGSETVSTGLKFISSLILNFLFS